MEGWCLGVLGVGVRCFFWLGFLFVLFWFVGVVFLGGGLGLGFGVGVLFVFFVGGLLMKWGVVMVSPNEGTSLDEEQNLNQSV